MRLSAAPSPSTTRFRLTAACGANTIVATPEQAEAWAQGRRILSIDVIRVEPETARALN